jgi:uncharacterized protein
MDNIVGQVATGANYYPRDAITDLIREAIDNGANVLLSAPRRVGKTSILSHLAEDANSGIAYLYLITEAVKSPDDFYKRIIALILKPENRPRYHNVGAILSAITNELKSIKLLGAEVQFHDASRTIDYRSECEKLLDLLAKGNNRVVLLIDEFPQAILNIIKNYREGVAISFLQELRELRHRMHFRRRVQFVFAGSIGLLNVVSRLDATSTINDLEPMDVTPLSDSEAVDFLTKLAAGMRIDLSDVQKREILSIIQWHIPYFIQIFMQHLKKEMQSERATPSSQSFNKVVDGILGQKLYFDHWKNRLRNTLSQDDYAMAERILNAASKQVSISRAELFQIVGAKKGYSDRRRQRLESRLNSIIDLLQHDGYINTLTGDPPQYAFISPFLKVWWARNVAI